MSSLGCRMSGIRVCKCDCISVLARELYVTDSQTVPSLLLWSNNDYIASFQIATKYQSGVKVTR